MSSPPFSTLVAEQIWDTKYRYRDGDAIHDQTIEDTWRRVADAVAGVEEHYQENWAELFYRTLEGFRFLPGGRILAGAGTRHDVTLFNCFVMGLIDDSMDGIFDALKEGALTMQQGGGVGYDFSTLRPQGTRAKRVGGIASGPVSFMRIWDSTCGTLLSTGARRGAMMATLRCDHPDIEAFIDTKKDPSALRHFNLSVLISDDFMQALKHDADWPLVFPLQHLDEDISNSPMVVRRVWSGSSEEQDCRVLKVVKAKDLWQKIMQANYNYAEPGVLFIDRINQQNNLAYREQISATNPCGEIPLPPYGACNLGSINLTQFVQQPFSPGVQLDMQAISKTVEVAVRMLDNVIDLSRYPLEAQRRQALATRRIGLGITGLADTLIMLGLRYSEPDSYEKAGEIMQTICHAAYRCSISLANEKGAFPLFDKEAYCRQPFIQSLPEDIQQGIAAFGIRNSHLMAIAPTGTISLLANNISSGLEPVYHFDYQRKILQMDGSYQTYSLSDYAFRAWQQLHGDQPLPHYFVESNRLLPQAHLEMQAAIQPYVDNAISKTINVPEYYSFNDFQTLYQQAYDMGLKGCTTFRPNPVTGAILTVESDKSRHCCSIEREAD
jgi:ribonucleoside-diphosphate reductase alpha chain